MDNALNTRGGLTEVRRRSSGHGRGRPTNVGIRLDFTLDGAIPGHYAFDVAALAGYGYAVQTEECAVDATYFRVERGVLRSSTEPAFPAVTPDRLALVGASGMAAFRPVFDALTSMGFYNLNPKSMREPQNPQDGRLLKPGGENIASVLGQLQREAPERMAEIRNHLKTVAPMVHGVERKQIGPFETLEFRQEMAGTKHLFPAQNMSDGTLRALGVLTALFQGSRNETPLLIGIEEPETALHPATSAALREALAKASEQRQIIVTSHSPDLLDSPDITADQLLTVVSQDGKTRMAPLDQASRSAMRDQLFSAGELLRLNQLDPDITLLDTQRHSPLFEGALP
ncbi:AAA family ATPase [Verminephrobacter aporrectodeae]|uniref:AAA family ATPase n=1 Tax=Verminephrobacter aporrectodeae TaxID=1110389 RepID=UPI002244F169|nr:ATP-binding protein [Verminephrobacter aporrectodeae]